MVFFIWMTTDLSMYLNGDCICSHIKLFEYIHCGNMAGGLILFLFINIPNIVLNGMNTELDSSTLIKERLKLPS